MPLFFGKRVGLTEMRPRTQVVHVCRLQVCVYRVHHCCTLGYPLKFSRFTPLCDFTAASNRRLLLQDPPNHCEGEDLGQDPIHAARRHRDAQKQVGASESADHQPQNH